MKRNNILMSVFSMAILVIIIMNQSWFSKDEFSQEKKQGAMVNTESLAEMNLQKQGNKDTKESNQLDAVGNEDNNQYHNEIAETEEMDKKVLKSSDFNFVKAWNSFEEKNYVAAAEILGLSDIYLNAEGQDLKGAEAKHLEKTIKNIQTLISSLLKNGAKDHHLIAASFSDVGLNLGKVYLAISVEMISKPNDSAFYYSKTIALLEKVIPTLQGDEKEKVDQLFLDLVKYKKALKKGNQNADELKEMNERMFWLLEKRKVNF